MIKELLFKLKHKRAEKVSPAIIDDLKWFLDFNYISEDSTGEPTGAFYDTAELTEYVEPEGMPWKAEECESTSSELPADDGLSASYDYSQGSIARDVSDAPYDIWEAEYSITDRDVLGKSISYYREAPPTPKCNSKRRAFPSLPQLKKEKQLEERSQTTILQTPQIQQQSLEDVISALGLTFQQTLLKLIDTKGYTDSQVYRKANLDRKLFSKIRCNKDYKPSKQTALSLAIALELNLDEATDLLGRAGLALSPSSLTDMIVKYCITHQIYDIYDVNALLYEHDQQLLGC